jgi:hypothetical protein
VTIPFPNLRKPRTAIEPGLKAFIDDLLVPMLVRDAMRDLRAENRLAPEKLAVAKSQRSGEAQ